MNKLIFIFLGIFGSITLHAQSASPIDGKVTTYTIATKATPDEQVIINDYKIWDYTSLEMSETRAQRELTTSQERKAVATKTIASAKGYGGNEVAARANTEIKEAEFIEQKARKALAIIKTKKEEWTVLQQQQLLDIKSADGKTLKAYFVALQPPHFRIATAEGRVFSLTAAQLSPETVKLLTAYDADRRPLVNSANQITITPRKAGNLSIKGVFIGMTVPEATQKLKENRQATIQVLPAQSDNTGNLAAYNINYIAKGGAQPNSKTWHYGGSIYANPKTQEISTFYISGDLSNTLFNTYDLALKPFAQNFIDAYGITELKPVTIREKPALHFESQYGWSVYIYGDKGIELFKTPPRQFN